MSFPAVPAHTLCVFQGHKVLHDAGNTYLRQLCLGHGCSAWDKAARCQSDHLPVACARTAEPSRPHLLRHCPRFSALRLALGPCADRIGERLLARAVPEIPAAPSVVDPAEVIEDLAACIDGCWPQSGALLLGTDRRLRLLLWKAGVSSLSASRARISRLTGRSLRR